MDPNQPNPEIIAVDRVRDRVLVEFSNGEGWVYSAELLYSIRSQAQSIPDTTDFENHN
jgi:hypothetical protein